MLLRTDERVFDGIGLEEHPPVGPEIVLDRDDGVYMSSFILSFFGVGIPYIHGSGLIGIGFSLFVVVIASLNLVLDFDFIEQGAEQGAPKYMEWYGAFGLIVTLVWLYLEILHLLAKLQSRR